MVTTIQKVRTIVGGRIFLMFLASVPLGILLGLAEIGLGFSLQQFLGAYGLTPVAALPRWLPLGLQQKPVLILLIAGSLRTLLMFGTTLLSYVALDAYTSKVRTTLAAILPGRADLNERLAVSEVSMVLSDVGPKSATFVAAIFQGMTASLSLLITVAALARLSFPLTVVTVASLLFFGMPMLITRKLFQRYSANVYKYIGLFHHRILKDFRNWDFLKIIGRTRTEAQQLELIDERIHRNNVHYVIWNTGNTLWPQLAALFVVTTVVVANYRYAFTAGAILIPFIYLLTRMAVNMGNLATTVGSMQFNWPFVDRLTELLLNPRQPAPTPARSAMAPGSLRSMTVKNLVVGRKTSLLENLSFQAKAGDFLCFTGESGRGKTTLLMTLIGLVPPLAGRVEWDERDLAAVDMESFRHHVAYSGADPFLLDLSIRENLLLGNEDLKITDAQIEPLLDRLECGFVRNFPDKLGHKLLEGGEGISAGQKQRLSILRAVLRRPRLLLLDEASANINIETEAKVVTEVRALLPEAIILAVSHRSSLQRFATQVIPL